MSPFVVAAGTLVLLAFLLWFALGTHRNIRRGNELLAWLQPGLPLFGPRTTLRWLGSSAVQLDITEPGAPFRGVGVTIVLEPRDLGWLWAFARVRGRRDFLILRGSLEGPPGFELEAGGPGWTGRDRLERIDWTAWERTEWGGGEVAVGHSPAAATAVMEAAWIELAAASGGVWRLSVRREEPHLEVHVLPPERTGDTPGGAVPLARAFSDLGSAVAKEGKS